jgi:hypothetical protein
MSSEKLRAPGLASETWEKCISLKRPGTLGLAFETWERCMSSEKLRAPSIRLPLPNEWDTKHHAP